MARQASKKTKKGGVHAAGKKKSSTPSEEVAHVERKETKKEEDSVNYGEAADSFAMDCDNEDVVGDSEKIEETADVDENDDHHESNSDDESDDDVNNEKVAESISGDEEDEDEEEEDAAASLFKNTAEDENESDDEDADDDDDDDADHANRPPFGSLSSEQYTFDLRNMLAVNTDQLPSNSLYTDKSKTSDEKNISIPLDAGHGLNLDEEYLLTKATAGCSELIRALWQLPTEQGDAGPLVTLPSYDEIRLPRALPPPPPKQETKWEKFAKAKGLPLNKEKRSRKVWDEASQSWLYRHGYEKANKEHKEWPIMEVGANDDPYQDPWEKLREAKRSRVEKNMESRMKNEERAGNIAKGATNRVVKAREQAYKAGKDAGRKDVVALPTGVPVDLKDGASNAKLRGKPSTMAALSAVQRSTASLGKFDKMREGEPERKKIVTKTKKRKYESATDKKVLSSEGDKSLKILNAVMNGGGAAKEKAIRKGQLAKGETAYDYEYNDGLGASTFKKKKGRAGAGKMKKMTKKRAK